MKKGKEEMKPKTDPYASQRREVPPPPQVHRDRTKYTRKVKHKNKNYED